MYASDPAGARPIASSSGAHSSPPGRAHGRLGTTRPAKTRTTAIAPAAATRRRRVMIGNERQKLATPLAIARGTRATT